MHVRPNRPASVRAHPSRVCPALAVLLAVGAGCGGTSPPDDTEARTVIETFIGQLRNGQIDDAWQSTTSDFKSDEGLATFRQYVRQRKVLSGPLEFAELKQVEVHGLTRWEGLLHPPAGEKSPPATVRTMIAEESGVWKVERIEVE